MVSQQSSTKLRRLEWAGHPVAPSFFHQRMQFFTHYLLVVRLFWGTIKIRKFYVNLWQKITKELTFFSWSLVKSTLADNVILLRSSRGKRHSKERRILFLLAFELIVYRERYSSNLTWTERVQNAKLLHFPCRPPSAISARCSTEDDPKRLIFWDLCYNSSTTNFE